MLHALLDVSAVPSEPVGAGVYTMELARGLAARSDIELTLLSRRDDLRRWSEIAPSARIAPVAPSKRPSRLAWEQSFAPRLARRRGVELWHGPHYTLPLRVPAASVVTVHDLTFFDHPQWHERSKVVFFRRMIRAALRRADEVIAVSEHTARRLAELAPGAHVTVAAHGVDTHRFCLSDDRDADLAVLGALGVVPPYIAFQGTLEPRKNLPRLVRAFAHVTGDRPDLRLVIAGSDGWGAQEVRDAIARSGVATRIVRLGYVHADVVAPLLRQAEVVAYPSLEEGFGLPALEALACGSPLVTSANSAMSEIAGPAAVYVEPRDERSVARGLLEALEPATASRLRSTGPPRAQSFTWGESVTRHVDAYRRAHARRNTDASFGR